MKYFNFAVILAASVFAISYAGATLESRGGLAAVAGLIDTSSWQATSTPISTPITDAIAQLQSQIQDLVGQISDLRIQIKANTLRSKFTRTLKKGDSGKDVTALQHILAQYPELYPAGTEVTSTVSGFYGSLTKEAISALQEKAGLHQTGIFDSETMKALADYQGQDGASPPIPAIDTSSISTLENQVAQIQSDLANADANISDLQNQVSNIASQIGDQSVSAPAPSPPPATTAVSMSISGVQAGSITNSAAIVSWTTNLSSNSEVDYSTNSTLSSSVTIVSSSTMATNHSLSLRSLNHNTKYYYRVMSNDSAGHSGTSAIQFFTTSN